jgi:hypothetical protein
MKTAAPARPRAFTAGLAFAVTLSAALSGGCGSSRATARAVLVGVALVAGGAAIGSTVISSNKEDSLRADAQTGSLSGRAFADRDAEGQRWNRAARASTFVAGIALVGLGVLWEMSLGDRALMVEAPAAALGPTPGDPAPMGLAPSGAAPPVAAPGFARTLR